jgi:diguanylate cyclase (GGDEF)-like protein/PAS domain S-box-containing protein
MNSDLAKKPTNDQQASLSLGPEEELRQIRKKYDDFNRQMDEILTVTMERSNRIIMETEIANIIMSQVFNASNDGIWAVDKNYKVIRVNKKLLDLLDKPARAVMGSKCYALFPEGCPGHGQCPMEKIMNGDPMVEQERTLRAASGRNIPFLVTSTPLFSLDQSVIGLVETFTDITERKHTERVLQRANQELERLATEDGLTKLSNRRRFDEYLELEWRRQARAHNQISLIMSDVDFFKKYNDQYGHQAGDLCLKSVASAMKKGVLRPSDLIARYGGEEFAIIMPETDIKGAWHIAEGIREELARKRIRHSQSSVAPYVTISCGIASMFPRSDSRPQTLIQRADQGLYRAKQRGRNCIVVVEDPAPQ